MLQTIIFYVFSFVLLSSAVMVVASRNPVHAVLFLILCFFNAAGLFVLIGAEFVAFILVIVYVGAVAVLFLFVVMMLDINFRELRQGFKRYLPVGAAVGMVLLAQLVFVTSAWVMNPDALKPPVSLAAQVAAQHAGVKETPVPQPSDAAVENTRAIGDVLYTDYIYPFQVSGLILLVAMIGAIVLTLHHKTDVRRQRPSQQLDRQFKDVIALEKIQPGQGIDV